MGVKVGGAITAMCFVELSRRDSGRGRELEGGTLVKGT